MTAAEATPTGGYGEGNGGQEVRISGWGASIMARGTNVVVIVVLMLGLIGLGATNWYALRLLRDEVHDHMLTVDAKAAAQSQIKSEISEEHKALVGAVKADHKEMVEAVQAAVWLLAQDEKTRRQLQLVEPPGIQKMQRPQLERGFVPR